MAARNWFEGGSASYMRFRPGYPPALSTALAERAPRRDVAVDVGCGNGQLTTALAEHFETVFGFDASEAQLAHAPAHPRIVYRQSAAEELPLADGTAALMTVAQAAHWFDLARFCDQARRVLIPGGLLALIAYGPCRLEEDIQPILHTYYLHTLGPFWSPSRAFVDGGYRDFELPFEERTAPELTIEDRWDLAHVLGYVETWSATRNAREMGAGSLVEDFRHQLAAAWGPPERARALSWPLHLRLFAVG